MLNVLPFEVTLDVAFAAIKTRQQRNERQMNFEMSKVFKGCLFCNILQQASGQNLQKDKRAKSNNFSSITHQQNSTENDNANRPEQKFQLQFLFLKKHRNPKMLLLVDHKKYIKLHKVLCPNGVILAFVKRLEVGNTTKVCCGQRSMG